MSADTKKRILEAALEMFSKNGYAGTNIRELAGAIDMGKSSMYRHFESKEELWNTVLETMNDYYNERFGSTDNLPPVPENGEGLVEMTMRMINVTVNDRNIIMTRKILQTEQFRDERIRDLATKHFITDIQEMFSRIFDGMMKNGSMKKGDTEMLAFAYTAPVTALVHLCDRDPDSKPDALKKAENFVRQFVGEYCLKQLGRKAKQ